DVARLAGVSPAVVSVVLNEKRKGNVRVSPQTEQRVRAAIRSLGYVPNPVARSLAKGQNRLLGVFTYEAIFPLQYRDFYYPFVMGIEQEAEQRGYDLLLFTRAAAGGGRRQIYQDGVNCLQLADGAILLGLGENKRHLRRLLRDGYRFVYVGRREVRGSSISYVAADYARATAEIVEHLIALGHRRIAYLGRPEITEAVEDRETGYRTALKRLKTSPALVHRASPVAPATVSRLLEEGATVCLAEDDRIARQLDEAIRVLGKRVPDDLSYAVLGDPLVTSDGQPDWACFKIPREDMGRQAVRILIDLISSPNRDPLQVTMPCTFVPGGTIGPPPTSREIGMRLVPPKYTPRRRQQQKPKEG
ncbi:MAG TPA: LacI family DNA-binding transcriptional regulator, partial [bacterium]|nr:LacI family DNA-binding transcriptional regulator [bacterium]